MRNALWAMPLLAIAVFAGCRDAPALFESPELEPLGPAPYQLTFSIADDAAPVWVGDSLLYLAEDPALDLRVLRVIDREGGPAAAVFPEIQGGAISVTFEWAAASPDGRRVAMTTLLSNHPGSLCVHDAKECVPAGATTSPTPSRLESALLRVRLRDEGGPPELDQNLVVPFEGRFFDSSLPTGGLTGTWVIDLYPFQKTFNTTGKPPARPSWSPDGSTLALSDGLQILTWTPGPATAVAVPDTDDGIQPAWSPDGTLLAFVHLARGAESSAFCEYRNGALLRCVEQRTEWEIDAKEIVIVRPDGTDRQVLAHGEEPAWSPDGNRIYYTAPDGIRSVETDGSNDMAVPGAERGEEPAVSPDGRWLAFSRSDSGPRNIWIVELLP